MNAHRILAAACRASLETLREAIAHRLTLSATAHLDDRLRADVGLRPRATPADADANNLAMNAWR